MKKTIKYFVSGMALGATLVGSYTAGRVNGYMQGVEAQKAKHIERVIEAGRSFENVYQRAMANDETRVNIGMDSNGNIERRIQENEGKVDAIEDFVRYLTN